MVFVTFFLLFIVIGYPIWDYYYMKKVKKDGVNKWRLYGTIISTQWLAVLVLWLYWTMTNRSFSSLFVYEPPIIQLDKSVMIGLAVSMILGVVIGAGILLSSKNRRPNLKSPPDNSLDFLLPKTMGERVLFLFVAITAGFCEELIFRGVMVYYFSHLPFELSVFAIGLITSIFFGIVHLYQGWKGVLLTGYLGGVFYFLFVGSGSLWVPIIFHFLIDVKFVFLPTKR
ncbi:CPBP family intramembrane glutamic endopeptidase [Bacillus alkalicellulosilyticus]|uniref:CPBP family intramembrane glutamic endopeptidase n=1 Tax=Alkalihalobacterium alkalicellulosilyticum TaxID=1912214 RepID=UPI000995F764|nr:CPBP family intramembrane glutamic endopeptidase [Bacillus alkalicellulosilyticus]